MSNAQSLFPETNEAQDHVRTMGLVMVKPHAVQQGLDHIVEAMLRGDSRLLQTSLADQALRQTIERTELLNPIARDLSETRSGQKLIDLFYGDKTDRRYFPLIAEWYTGKVLFLPFLLDTLSQEQLTVDLDTLKGTTQTFDSSGLEVDASLGIRGILGSPYSVYKTDEIERMSDSAYRTAVEPMIQNFVHVCDKPGEAVAALELIGCAN